MARRQLMQQAIGNRRFPVGNLIFFQGGRRRNPRRQPQSCGTDSSEDSRTSSAGSFLRLPAGAAAVVGLLHAGFNGTNIMLSLPTWLVAEAFEHYLASAPLDFTTVPTFEEVSSVTV